jgi:heat shock protein HtpX
MKSSYRVIRENLFKTYFLMSLIIGLILALGYFFAFLTKEVIIFYISVILAFLLNFISYFYGDKIITYLTNAKEVKKDDLPEIYRVLENLTITAGLPKTPKLYIINSPALNAFATGRNYNNALVALTTGLIEKLTIEEIEGVIAHELAHIKNRDITLMMISTVLIGIVSILADIFLRWSWANSNNDNNKSSNPIFLALGIILAFMAPIFAQLIHLAISRKREFMADATGVLLTRNPNGLANALEKIARQTEILNVPPSTAGLFIANPFNNRRGFINWLGNLFSTHPPIEERIKTLKNMVI